MMTIQHGAAGKIRRTHNRSVMIFDTPEYVSFLSYPARMRWEGYIFIILHRLKNRILENDDPGMLHNNVRGSPDACCYTACRFS